MGIQEDNYVFSFADNALSQLKVTCSPTFNFIFHGKKPFPPSLLLSLFVALSDIMVSFPSPLIKS